MRDANATVALPDGGGVALLADLLKNDQFVIHKTDAAAAIEAGAWRAHAA